MIYAKAFSTKNWKKIKQQDGKRELDTDILE